LGPEPRECGERRRNEQYEALEEMRATLDDETPVEEVLEKALQTRRRTASSSAVTARRAFIRSLIE
jgi:hypothetical protein